MNDASPLVAVIMGSKSDWETMRHADELLTQFEVPHECRIVSAHRTPLWLAEFAAEAEGRGIEVIIAGAGGAAHLPGMAAAQTILPVLGVPVESQALKGHRFAAVDRADARRRAGRDAGHRQGGGSQRRPVGRRHPGDIAAAAAGKAASLIGKNRPQRVLGETLP